MALPFDLRQLRYFAAVARAGSFRAAAEELHISQPPLSRQVAELELALKATLLERRSTGVALTPAGRVALDLAEDILARAERLPQALASARGKAAKTLRIGVTAAITVPERARLVTTWRKVLPGRDLQAEAGYSRDLIPALKAGRLDFALIGTTPEVRLAGLATREVMVSPLVAALPSKHPLARRRRVSLLDVDLPLFWIPRALNPDYHDFCMRYFRRKGYRPKLVLVEPGQLQTLQRIATGEGWTIPNAAAVEKTVRGVAYRDLEEGKDLAIPIAAAWREDDGNRLYEELAAAALRALRPAKR